MTLGDLLIHEGPALEAQDFAAEVFHADKTYFVLNGSSSSNKVVTNALLTPGDLVLYDRNNHKSVALGALIQAGATPVYLETARNPYGFIGGIDAHCFDETYLRQLAAERDPEKPRPSGLSAWLSSSSALMTGRCTMPAMSSTASVISATTSSLIRPGSAMNSSFPCSRTTRRCSSICMKTIRVSWSSSRSISSRLVFSGFADP